MPYMGAISAQLDRPPVGISRAAGDEGQFDYLCGVEVARFADAPPELTRLEIPPRRYAVFQHRRHVSTLPETYRAIWNEALPALREGRRRRAGDRAPQPGLRSA
jgi:AraC family transcriptional regulator